jgi:hypothetical protein
MRNGTIGQCSRQTLYERLVNEYLPNPVAAEALERIGALYAVEGDINRRSPEERREVRNTRRTASSCGHLPDDEHLYQGWPERLRKTNRKLVLLSPLHRPHPAIIG